MNDVFIARFYEGEPEEMSASWTCASPAGLDGSITMSDPQTGHRLGRPSGVLEEIIIDFLAAKTRLHPTPWVRTAVPQRRT